MSILKHQRVTLGLTLVGLSSVPFIGACDKGRGGEEQAAKNQAEDGEAAKAKDEEAKSEDGEAKVDGAGTEVEAAKGKEAHADEQPGDDAPAGETPPPALVAPPGSTEPGPAYFAMNSKGVARIAASGEVSMIAEDPAYFMSSMFTGPDGAVYVLDMRALNKIEGDELVPVVEFPLGKSLGQLDVAASGELWGVGFNEIRHYAEGKWTSTPKDELGAGVEMLSAVAIAGDGTPYVGSSKQVFGRVEGKWSAVDLSSLREMSFLFNMSSGPDGKVYASSGRSVVKLGPGKVQSLPIATDDFNSYTVGLAYAPDGQILVAASGCELARIDPASGRTVWTMNAEEYDCGTLGAVAIDGNKRAWVAHREGLSVIADDKSATEYVTGTFPQIVGMVSHVVVVAGGPKLPTASAPKTATLTGKLLVDGTPLVNTPVELCATPKSWGPSSPCAKAKVKFAGTSNEKGEFTFEDVPIGDYHVAAQIDGKWQSSFLLPFAAKLRPGETYDLGGVKYQKI